MVASFSSSAEGRYAPDVLQRRPFFIGEAAALYDTKAGEVGITYTWELGDQETLLSKMCNNDHS